MNEGFKHTAVASGHHITTKVMSEVLKAGGNAFDATVAGILVMTISEPAMASLMAGGFANVFSVKDGNFIIDYFCQTPINKTQKNPNYTEIEVDFGESQEYFYAGPASMAVSGAVKMIHYFLDNYCRMELKELARPAMEYCSEGLSLTEFQALDLNLLRDIFGLQKAGKEIFFKEDSQVKKTGDKIYMSDFTDFLESFIREKSDWFYKSEIAELVCNYTQSQGGWLQKEDFEKYTLNITKPLLFKLSDHTISAPSLPSLGGGLQALFCQTIKNRKSDHLSSDHVNNLIQGFEACSPFLKDGPALLSHLNESEEFIKTAPFLAGGTSHFNVTDKWGNGISLSISIGEGSGYFIPGTNIHMNNMLGETALLPNGLDSWHLSKRLMSMMSPTIVFGENNFPQYLLGTGGATRIPFTLGQTLYNLLILKMDLDTSIHSPRMYKKDKLVYIEKGFDMKDYETKLDIKQWDTLELLFGGVHVIDLKNNIAIGDIRREGNAWIN